MVVSVDSELYCPFCGGEEVSARGARGLFQCLDEDCGMWFEEEDQSAIRDEEEAFEERGRRSWEL